MLTDVALTLYMQFETHRFNSTCDFERYYYKLSKLEVGLLDSTNIMYHTLAPQTFNKVFFFLNFNDSTLLVTEASET